MEQRFKITSAFICPIYFQQNKDLKLNEDYFWRVCVIDLEKNIAVDIEHQLQYTYIKTMSGLYYKSIVNAQNLNGKRAAILGCDEIFNGIRDDSLLSKAYKVKENLMLGKEYPDGNEILNNDEYLKLLNEEKKKIKVKKRK